jgi:hypothetical protein
VFHDYLVTQLFVRSRVTPDEIKFYSEIDFVRISDLVLNKIRAKTLESSINAVRIKIMSDLKVKLKAILAKLLDDR